METDERGGGREREREASGRAPSLPSRTKRRAKEVPSFPLLLLLFLFPMGVSFPHLCEEEGKRRKERASTENKEC